MSLSVLPTRSADLRWLQSRTGAALSASATGLKAVDRGGRIRGLVAFDLWTPASCYMHVALDSPIAARALLHPAFAYPFLDGRRLVVLGVVSANNARSMRLAVRLGFREAHRVANGWSAGVDLVIHEMRIDECRWIPGTIPARMVA